MEEEEKVNEELKKLSASFPAAKHAAPDGYFEEFPDRIMARFQAASSVRKEFRITWRKWAAVAAIMAGLLVVTLVLIPRKDTALQPISSLEAYQYIEEHIDEFEILLESEVASLPLNGTEEEADIIDEYLMEEL